MDYRRYTIPQLARETNTSLHTLYEWVRKGFLVPTQLSGQRKKFSIEAFLIAEQRAKQHYSQRRNKQTKSPIAKIPPSFFDSLLKNDTNSHPLMQHRNGGYSFSNTSKTKLRRENEQNKSKQL